MSAMNMKWIELEEYRPRELPGEALSQADGEFLWEHYGKQGQLAVDFPSPKTNYRWRLTSQGWVGFIPLSSNLGLHLVPKVPVANLFRMLEYVYGLREFDFKEGMASCQTYLDFYNCLAKILATWILAQARKGLYRSYRDRKEGVTHLRGRLDVGKQIRKPWSTRFDCEFQEHLVDIEDNQILAWTLYLISRSCFCSEEVARICRLAYRKLRVFVGLRPFTGLDCVRRVYSRLNKDYEPLHALCRFFLEQSGPSIFRGEHALPPFLIDMGHLFELFVATWLEAHPLPQFRVQRQEEVLLGTARELIFRMDLVLYDRERGRARCILDTKYKADDTPSSLDVSQMIAYAMAKGCEQAILVYPTAAIKPFTVSVQNIQVRSIAFPLEAEDLEKSGQDFLTEILACVEGTP